MMKRLLRILVRWPTERALLFACVLGLIALALMAAGVLLATPLPVVASMSVAQGIGVLACLLFGLFVVAEVAQRNPEW